LKQNISAKRFALGDSGAIHSGTLKLKIMYERIFKISVYNEDGERIMRYLYTDYSAAKKDAKRMVENRKEKSGVDFYKQICPCFPDCATVIYHFDDEVEVAIRESGWAEDDGGRIRMSEGADYTGNANYKWFDTEKEFVDFIRDSQPVFLN
jgi:hypothetical protein